MTTVIYIAGYGRSGSTLLELILQSRTGGTGFGELVHLGEEVTGKQTFGGGICSCGEPLPLCPFWAETVQALEQRPTLDRVYTTLIPGLIAQHPGPVIDSSKTTRGTLNHLLRLRRQVTRDIRIIHLSRRPSEVYRSWSTAQNRPGGAGARRGMAHRLGFVASYLYAELIARTAARIMAAKFTTVRFVDLTADASTSWRAIATALELEPGTDAFDSVENRGHGIAGNRLRHKNGDRIEIESSMATDGAPAESGLLRLLDRILRHG